MEIARIEYNRFVISFVSICGFVNISMKNAILKTCELCISPKYIQQSTDTGKYAMIRRPDNHKGRGVQEATN